MFKMNTPSENVSNDPKKRVQDVLAWASVPLRCQHLSMILEEVSSKDANFVLCAIINSIFSTGEEMPIVQQQTVGNSWGLRIITLSEHCYEFNSLRGFLSPTGPLLTLIYRLTHDPFQLLPFPVAWLPPKVRTEIEDGTANMFYTNKVQKLGPGKSPTNIMLNAFEYYIFNFTHFLVGSHCHRWNLSWGAVNDALYLTVLEDYLVAFLPCDGSMPPGPPSAPISPRGVLSPMAQRHIGHINLTPHSLHVVSPIRPPRSDTAFGHLAHFDMTVGGIVPGGMTSSPIQSQKEVNLWTSQVVFQVLLEMWINQCSFPVSRPSVGAHSGAHPSMESVFVPSSDHVRVVRIMVKHFHYFSNSVRANQPSPLDYLKRNLWPMSRRSFYLFLKHLFVHWPLDSSFRLVLETWLSYIQPWRYLQFLPRQRSPGGHQETEGPRFVERKWMSFVAENLLFYSNLFNLLIGRLLRLDLVSPKNAQILFRVAKVFSQENLTTYIREIEETLGSETHMQRCFLGVGAMPALGASSPSSPNLLQETPGAGPDQFSPHQLLQMARSHIVEVEGQNHHYTALFSESVAIKVSQFLKVAKNAQDAIGAELVTNCALTGSKESSPSAGWVGFIFKSIFEGSKNVTDENTIEEVQRSLTHLEMSIKQFCLTFKVPPPAAGPPDTAGANFSSLKNLSNIVGSPEKYHAPDTIPTGAGPVLTSLGRYQLMNGLKRFDLKYEGDPDLRPICSDEVTFLVRLLHRLSRAINRKYEREIEGAFARGDFIGRLCRVFLSPPRTVTEYVDASDASPQKRFARNLPPRISLRVLANKHLLGFTLLLYFLLYLLSFSSWRVTVFFLFPFILTWVLLKAVLETNYPRTPSNPLQSQYGGFGSPGQIGGIFPLGDD